MSKVFFIADTHFGDSVTFQTSGEYKFFPNVKAKDETIIRNWNETVTAEDTVFILGDFGDMNYWSRLPGKKFLIKGNHDRGEYCNSLYPIVYENFFILSHEPMWVDEDGPYANIFGHVHNNPIYKTVSSRSYCVCACRNGWTLVEFDTIRSAMINE